MKVLALRRPDSCATCSRALAVGDRAGWDSATRSVRCMNCVDGAAATPEPQPQSQPGTAAGPRIPEAVPQQRAGASAQHEYQRRSSRREDRIRAAHPRLGGLILALNDEPASTRVWAQGAAGERAVAVKLDNLREHGIPVLHDRAQRRSDGRPSRANIDHLAVASSGVWVIDAKTHKGALEVRRSGGVFSPRVERLYINGRDQTKLVDGVKRQVAAVAAELAAAGAAVPVHAALCFVGTELPWFGASKLDGVHLVGRRGLRKRLLTAGDVPPDDRLVIAEFLGSRFVPAAG